MINYEYKKITSRDESYLESYFNLTQSVFGFDLSKWRDAGHWNDKYRTHTLIYKDEVIANIGAAIMKVQVYGKEVDAVQLGAVGVLDKYRGLGLGKIIMEKTLEEYKDFPLVFLLASDDVSGFYMKLGFKRIKEALPYIDVEEDIKAIEPLKLTLESEELKRLANSENLKHSALIDGRNNKDFYWYHLLYGAGNHVYYIKEKDIIFIATYKNDEIHIYDILSENKVEFEDIKEYILKANTKKVWFYFTPDCLDVNYSTVAEEENDFYVRGDVIENMDKARFPEMSTT